jgi:acyl homoserine lactone synthase
MLVLIDPSNYEFHRRDLDNMYRLRHKVFFEKLKWDVKSSHGMEKDEYDEKHATYIIYKDEQGIVRGCTRLIEMINPCMFDGPFRFLLPDLENFKHSGCWEQSRIAVDHNFDENYTPQMASQITASVYTAYLHFALELGAVKTCLLVSFPAAKKLYSRYGFSGKSVAERVFNGNQLLVTSYVPLRQTYEKLLTQLNCDFAKPILSYVKPIYAYTQEDYDNNKERRAAG